MRGVQCCGRNDEPGQLAYLPIHRSLADLAPRRRPRSSRKGSMAKCGIDRRRSPGRPRQRPYADSAECPNDGARLRMRRRVGARFHSVRISESGPWCVHYRSPTSADIHKSGPERAQPSRRPPTPIGIKQWEPGVSPDHSSGGYEIRTREGVNPTRFPTLRPFVHGRSQRCSERTFKRKRTWANVRKRR